MLTSRSASQGNASSVPPSIEVVRRRARHRLIGASVLVLLGVVGFSLLFDTQPRSLPVDIPIVIPAKNSVPALEAPKVSADKPAQKPSEPPAAKPATDKVAAAESLSPSEEVVPSGPPPRETASSATKAPAEKPAAAKPEPAKPVATPEAKPAPKAPVKPEPAKPSEADRARSLLEGKTVDKASEKSATKSGDKVASAGDARIVVQVGAFADAARAREARLKLEHAGLKTYTHVADTPDGKRIRVRVGPFATKAEADKAAARVKALGLPAAILTL